MEGFTKLEEAALRAFADLSGEPELFMRWMGSAKVTERKNTGRGFYTNFDAVFPKPQFRVAGDFKGDPISGPILALEGFGPDAVIDLLLWDGTLEGFQLGTDINLRDYDLAELRGVWTESWGAPDKNGIGRPEPRS